MLQPFLAMGFTIAFILGLTACGSSSSPPPEPEPPFAEKLSNFLVTSKGIFFAVEVDSGRYELFCVDPITAERHGISDEFSATRGLKQLAISPDLSKIAYRADKDFDGFDELYVNSLAGDNEVQVVDSLPTTTSESLVSGTGQLIARVNWQWTPDSTRIVFQSDIDSDGTHEILSVLSDGTSQSIISADLPTQCVDTDCWKISPDSGYVSFLSEQDNQNGNVAQNIYIADIDGANLTRLNQQLSNNSRIRQWQWMNDASRIFYVSQNVGSPAALYSVTPDAITRGLISQGGQQNGVNEFLITSDNTQVVFSEDSNTAEQYSLFIADIDGLNRVELVDRNSVNNPSIINWKVSPTSQRVAFQADQETQGVYELFTVELDGQWHRKINSNLLPSGEVQTNWQWSGDGASILYFSDVESTAPFDELFVNNDDGSRNSKIDLSLQPNATLTLADDVWGSSNSRVIFQVENADQKIEGIYSVATDGSNLQRLTDSMESGDYILHGLKLSADRHQILFRQYQKVDDLIKLNLTSLDGSSNRSLVTLGQVDFFEWTSDASRIIYQVQLPGEVSEQLYSVLPDGSSRVRLY